MWTWSGSGYVGATTSTHELAQRPSNLLSQKEKKHVHQVPVLGLLTEHYFEDTVQLMDVNIHFNPFLHQLWCYRSASDISL